MRVGLASILLIASLGCAGVGSAAPLGQPPASENSRQLPDQARLVGPLLRLRLTGSRGLGAALPRRLRLRAPDGRRFALRCVAVDLRGYDHWQCAPWRGWGGAPGIHRLEVVGFGAQVGVEFELDGNEWEVDVELVISEVGEVRRTSTTVHRPMAGVELVATAAEGGPTLELRNRRAEPLLLSETAGPRAWVVHLAPGAITHPPRSRAWCAPGRRELEVRPGEDVAVSFEAVGSGLQEARFVGDVVRDGNTTIHYEARVTFDHGGSAGFPSGAVTERIWHAKPL